MNPFEKLDNDLFGKKNATPDDLFEQLDDELVNSLIQPQQSLDNRLMNFYGDKLIQQYQRPRNNTDALLQQISVADQPQQQSEDEILQNEIMQSREDIAKNRPELFKVYDESLNKGLSPEAALNVAESELKPEINQAGMTGETKEGFGSFLKEAWKEGIHNLGQMPGTMLRALPSTLDLMSAFSTVPVDTGEELEKPIIERAEKLEEWASQEFPPGDLSQKYRKPPESIKEYITDPKRAAMALTQIPRMGVFVGSTLIHPALGMAVMYAAEGGESAKSIQEYEKQTGEKVDDDIKMMIPIAVGSINAALEKVGIDKILKVAKIPGLKGKLFQSIISTATEGSTEGLQEIVSILGESGYNDEAKEFKKQIPRVIESSYMGLILGAGGSIASGTAGQLTEQRQEQQPLSERRELVKRPEREAKIQAKDKEIEESPTYQEKAEESGRKFSEQGEDVTEKMKAFTDNIDKIIEAEKLSEPSRENLEKLKEEYRKLQDDSKDASDVRSDEKQVLRGKPEETQKRQPEIEKKTTTKSKVESGENIQQPEEAKRKTSDKVQRLEKEEKAEVFEEIKENEQFDEKEYKRLIDESDKVFDKLESDGLTTYEILLHPEFKKVSDKISDFENKEIDKFIKKATNKLKSITSVYDEEIKNEVKKRSKHLEKIGIEEKPPKKNTPELILQKYGLYTTGELRGDIGVKVAFDNVKQREKRIEDVSQVLINQYGKIHDLNMDSVLNPNISGWGKNKIDDFLKDIATKAAKIQAIMEETILGEVQSETKSPEPLIKKLLPAKNIAQNKKEQPPAQPKDITSIPEKGERKETVDVEAVKEKEPTPIVETTKEATEEIIEGKKESTIGTKEFKKRMTVELNKAIKKAKNITAEDEKNLKEWGKNPKLYDDKLKKIHDKYGYVNIHIPGDGNFKIVNTKEELERVRKQVGKLQLEKSTKLEGKQIPTEEISPLLKTQKELRRYAETNKEKIKIIRKKQNELIVKADQLAEQDDYQMQSDLRGIIAAFNNINPSNKNSIESWEKAIDWLADKYSYKFESEKKQQQQSEKAPEIRIGKPVIERSIKKATTTLPEKEKSTMGFKTDETISFYDKDQKERMGKFVRIIRSGKKKGNYIIDYHGSKVTITPDKIKKQKSFQSIPLTKPTQPQQQKQKTLKTKRQQELIEKKKKLKEAQTNIINAKDAVSKIKAFIKERRAYIDLNSFKTNKFIYEKLEKLTTQQREVIPFLIEKTEIPKKLERKDLENIYNKEKNNPELLNLVNDIQQRFDDSWKYMQQNMPELSAEQIKNYVTHIWDISKKKKNEVTNWFVTQNRFTKQRYIETLYKGVEELGLKPKILDIAEIIRIHDSIMHKVIANRKFVSQVKSLNKDGISLIARSDKAPVDWTMINHPALYEYLFKPGEKTRGEIISDELKTILNEMGVAIGRRINPRAWKEGEYRMSDPPEIRFQRFFQSKTAAHEIGHHLDVTLKLGENFLNQYQDELLKLNQERIDKLSKIGKRRYAESAEEQIAEFFAHLFTDPTKTSMIAPGATADILGKLRQDEILTKLVNFDFENKAKMLIEEQLNTLIKLPVKVHPDLAKPLKVIFDSTDSGEIAKAYETINGLIKKTWLSLSLFHHGALTETAIAIGPKVAYRSYKTAIKSLFTGNQLAFEKSDLAEDAIKHNLQLGASIDIPVQKIQAMLKTWEQKWKNTPVARRIPQFLRSFNEKWDKILWTYLHDSFKLYGYEFLVSKLDPAKIKDITKAKQEIAQFVNDTFGGQNWDTLMVNPKTVKFMQRSLLSADWTISTMRQALAPTGIGKVHQETVNLRRKMGGLFWLKAGLYFGVGINLLNAMFRWKDLEEHPEMYTDERKEYYSNFFNKTMFGNVIGNRSRLFVGRYDNGIERYVRWGKQFRELPEMIIDHGEFSPLTASLHKLGGKTSPAVQLGIQSFTGVTPSGFKNRDIYGKQGMDKMLGIAKTLIRTPIPFSMQTLVAKMPGGDLLMDPYVKDKGFFITDIAMPSGKGITPYKAIELFQIGIERKDERLITEVFQQTLQNNQDAYQLFKSALTQVKATNTKDINSTIKSIDDINKQLKLTKSLNDRRVLYRAKRKYLKQQQHLKQGGALLNRSLAEYNRYLKQTGNK